ncbi:hypothetical protein LUZ63_002882 [Rhynchospora breviuscula]|uniref:BED-type domain-containing protein n=1 Tax=Rhynchospora breviuscula TaxID=2022672 RepID=A0A9Q0CZK7_9POAL|nr:hypothetical protein LUZ63_002882 [Rhynchospora breviuscula]
MGPGLNFETPEEIDRIQAEAEAINDPQQQQDGAQAPACEEEEVNTKKRKTRKTTSEYWQYFTKGPTDEDGSYEAICKFCGTKYLQGQQRGTSSMKNHIEKCCKKFPRNKPDALQKMLHAAKVQAEAFYDKLVLWNLDKRTFCLVLDNASSNDACINDLFATTSIQEDLPADGKLFHQRCGCHILNLIVQDGLDVLKDEIRDIRETMKYIRHSQGRMEKFKLACSQANVPFKKLSWDVPTRWNSTYLMLELALELKLAICRYDNLDKRYNLNISDFQWEAVQALVVKLKVFYDATLKLSGTKYPTLNLFFTEFCEAYLTIKNMCSSPYPFIVQMGAEMHVKFDKYWTLGNSLLAIACVLDPRCKLAVVEYYMKQLCGDLDEASLDEEFDILAWWKLKTPKYPVLSRLTRDILAVPISIVASESAFSTSGRVLSTVRSSLNDESIEALICAQDWLRASISKNGHKYGDLLWAIDEGSITDNEE